MRSACSAGYYAPEGSLFCRPVPSHMYTASASTTVRPLWCSYSEYSALRQNSCTTCPADKWCPSDNFGPLDCPDQVDTAYVGTGVSAYTSFAGENQCFALTATRGGTTGSSDGLNTVAGGDASDYPSSEFDVHVAPGKYAQQGGSYQYDCPKGRECLFPSENIFV
jgi:hypothetical protein